MTRGHLKRLEVLEAARAAEDRQFVELTPEVVHAVIRVIQDLDAAGPAGAVAVQPGAGRLGIDLTVAWGWAKEAGGLLRGTDTFYHWRAAAHRKQRAEDEEQNRKYMAYVAGQRTPGRQHAAVVDGRDLPKRGRAMTVQAIEAKQDTAAAWSEADLSDPGKWYTRDEAAVILRVPPKKVARLFADGNLPGYRLCKSVLRIYKPGLLALLACGMK